MHRLKNRDSDHLLRQYLSFWRKISKAKFVTLIFLFYLCLQMDSKVFGDWMLHPSFINVDYITKQTTAACRQILLNHRLFTFESKHISISIRSWIGNERLSTCNSVSSDGLYHPHCWRNAYFQITTSAIMRNKRSYRRHKFAKYSFA